MGFFSKDHQLWFHNSTSETYYVAAVPNTDWEFADVTTNLALAIPSMLKAGISLPEQWTKVAAAKEALNSAEGFLVTIRAIGSLLYAAGNLGYSSLVKLGGGAYTHGTSVYGALTAEEVRILQESKANVVDFILGKGAQVMPGRTVLVAKTNVPFVSVSDLFAGSSGGVHNRTVVAVSQSFTRSAMFNANSDSAWVIQPNAIVRAREGGSQVADYSRGFIRTAIGDSLLAGGRLLANECISSPNRKYDLVYQADGNLEVRERDGTSSDRRVWDAGTSGTKPGFVTVQPDGNLAIYDADGRVVAETGDHGSGAANANRRLTMQDDGNLVLYTGDGKPVWDAWSLGSRLKRT